MIGACLQVADGGYVEDLAFHCRRCSLVFIVLRAAPRRGWRYDFYRRLKIKI